MAVATTTSRIPSSFDPPALASWTARLAVALPILISLALVGHSLRASQEVAERNLTLSSKLENTFASRQTSTQSKSAVGFLLLGATGAACWLLAPRRSFDGNRALLACGAIYIGWCLLSLLWSIDPQLTIRKQAILVLTLTAALGLTARFEFEDIMWIAIAVLGAFLFVGVLAEMACGMFTPWRSDYRFCGTVDPNDQGGQCALLALAAMLAHGPGRRDRPWLRWSIVAVALCGLWFTKSRTSLAAFLAAAALAVVLRERGPRRWLVLGAALAALCLAGMVYSFASVGVMSESFGIATMGRQEDVGTLSGRLPLWREAWKSALEHPWLGYGFEAYWDAKNIRKYSDQLNWQIPHAHNSYIDFVLQLGFVGLAAYSIWTLASMAVAWRRYEDSSRRAYLFVLCILALIVVHGITESKFPGAGVGGLLQMCALTTLIVRAPTQPMAPSPLPEPVPGWRNLVAATAPPRVHRGTRSMSGPAIPPT